jgi:hypothetical protein
VDPALPSPAGRLGHGASAAQQMNGKQHDSHNEDDVDESRGNVKRKKSEQPKNDQNCSEYPKHVSNSFYRKMRAD